MNQSKAIQLKLDSIETTGSLTSSVSKQCFIIKKNSIKKPLSSVNFHVICTIINHFDYITLINTSLNSNHILTAIIFQQQSYFNSNHILTAI